MSKSMRKKMAGVLSTVMIVGSVPTVVSANTVSQDTYVKAVTTEKTTDEQVDVEQGNVKVLDASTLELGSLTSDLECGEFTIKATSAKKVTIDESPRTTEEHHDLTKRIKLGGAGDVTYRSVEFSINEPATVTIYALSSSSTQDRPVSIYDAAGNEVVALTAVGENNITDVDKKIPALTAQLDAAGTYYIYSTKSVNLHHISVVEGQAQEVTTEGMTKPSVVDVTNNAVDPSFIDVTVEGTIADENTDMLWVKLYNPQGELQASEKVDTLVDGRAVVSFEPGVNGEYTVVCDAIREGSKEAISSDAYTAKVVIPLGEIEFTNVKTGKESSLNVEWNSVRSAVSYDVLVKEENGTYREVQTGLTETACQITGLTAGETYTIKVVAVDCDGNTVENEYTKTVALQEERFKTAYVGSGASGYITEHADGSVTLSAVAVGTGSGGKLADSEDGFLYYYTEVNPEEENFTLTATFVVDDSGSKDNQSGFGVMAVDTFEDGNDAARYFNSAGCMLRKYTRTVDGATSSKMGIPGGYFVTGYTAADAMGNTGRKLIDTAPFDWDYKSDYVTETNANPPKFEDGEEYTLTLRKSNTGFHAYMSNDTTNEVICYEPDLLLQQDKDKYYVGVCASRKITITVKDINFTTIHPSEDEAKIERPISYKTPSVTVNSTQTIGTDTYEAGFKAEFAGTIDVLDSEGNVVASDILVDPNNEDTIRATANLSLQKGVNTFKAVYTPLPKAEQGTLLGEYEDLTSYEPIEKEFTVEYKAYGTEANAVYVSPTGSADNKGTKASPLDIQTAIKFAQPGQEIVLAGGTYAMTEGIAVNRGHNGTEENPITIMSAPGERAVLDFEGCDSVGIALGGDYWHVYDMEVKNSGKAGVHITGNHNIAEKLTVHQSGNTGIQISGNASEPKSMWPSYNLVQSCESFNNCDAQANDADGFAAKLTVGDGNIFRYCIAHHNIDDGWDLYAKSTTGPIGEVIVENSVAYANGKLTEGDLIGEGNGFKLGGESIPVEHVLRNSISFGNLKNGVFSNSNPYGLVENVISVCNDGKNLYFNTNAKATDWKLNNFISYKGLLADEMELKGQDSLASTTNYLDGVNSEGHMVQDNWFENLDTSFVPTIAEDGSIDMGNAFRLTENAPEGVGTVFGANPNPTVITIGEEITDENTPVVDMGVNVKVSTNVNAVSVNQRYIITTDKEAIDISKLSIVYKADGMPKEGQNFWCDHAGILYSVAPWYVSVHGSVTGTVKEDTLTLTFDKEAELLPNASTMTVDVRLAKADWSAYSAFSNESVAVYYDGVRIN